MGEQLCFSCEIHPQKYVTGLCEKCHEIAIHASDSDNATVESIRALDEKLFPRK